jgi:NADP-dependent 3-hydroxy acid dehydrogenase YdfG
MKNIVITGASKGIGKAIALKFASENFNIAICARNENDLIQCKNELLTINPNIKVLYVVADVSNKIDRDNFVKKVLLQFSNIDILVNNAGTFLPGNTFDEPDGRLDFLLQTNVISAYEITRALLPNMIKKKSGYIFNMSSVAGLQAYTNGGSYSISKFALTGFSKNLRSELKQFNIRVSTIYPGAVLTDSWAGTDLPTERFIAVEDIANIIFTAYQMPESSLVEDIIIRPTAGDI